VGGDVFINDDFLTNHAVDALLDVYDFSRFDTVMDVGGGQGGLIARIVKRFGCKGMLFDVAGKQRLSREAGVAQCSASYLWGCVCKCQGCGRDRDEVFHLSVE